MIPVTIVKQVWYGDLEKLIFDTYGRRYSIPPKMGEFSNGSVHYLSIPDREWDWDGPNRPVRLADWAAEKRPNKEFSGWDAVWNYDNAEGPAFGEIIDDLFAKGLLDEGEYQLHIWW
jgi:hypothetical protein